MVEGKRPRAGKGRQTEKALTPDELARERWLPIPDWEGYEVSDMGRVRSWKHRITGRGRGAGWEVDVSRPPNVLSVGIDDGYLAVALSEKPHRVKRAKIHLLVIRAFRGEAPEGMQCAHGDGDRSNARLSNLRWTTAVENLSDRVKHGTHPAGSKNPRAKLTARKVANIRAAHAAGKRPKELAKRYRVHPNTIWHITSKRQWNAE